MLSNLVKACKACPLSAGCTSPVPGFGRHDAPIFLIGQSPGAQEDASGRPFVGPSGKLLRDTLLEYGVPWADVYRTNAVKCHPEGNKKAKVGEKEACLDWLMAEGALWTPPDSGGLIVIVGEEAMTSVWPKKKERPTLQEARGRNDLEWMGYPLEVMYHPAFVLRSPQYQFDFEDDIKRVAMRLGYYLPAADAKADYWIPQDTGHWWAVSGDCNQAGIVGLDTEFFRDNTMIGYSLSWAPGEAIYTPPSEAGLGFLEHVIWKRALKLAVHSAQADVPVVCKALGRPIESWPWDRTFDTCVAAYDMREPFVGLKALALKHFGVKMKRFEDMAATPEDFAALPLEAQASYAAADPDMTRRLALGPFAHLLPGGWNIA